MKAVLAFKGFNSKLQATMGNGIFKFEPGKTYEEKECKCAHNGFHCAENPLCALSYYRGMGSRYFIVEAAGDINQDGNGSRISCTRLTLKKEVSRTELAVCACKYMLDYPDREMESDHAVRDEGRCWEKGDFIIVRGKSPAAAGVEGSWLFLVQEEKGSNEVKGIYGIEVDGKGYQADTWYGIRGGAVCGRKN